MLLLRKSSSAAHLFVCAYVLKVVVVVGLHVNNSLSRPTVLTATKAVVVLPPNNNTTASTTPCRHRCSWLYPCFWQSCGRTAAYFRRLKDTYRPPPHLLYYDHHLGRQEEKEGSDDDDDHNYSRVVVTPSVYHCFVDADLLARRWRREKPPAGFVLTCEGILPVKNNPTLRALVLPHPGAVVLHPPHRQQLFQRPRLDFSSTTRRPMRRAVSSSAAAVATAVSVCLRPTLVVVSSSSASPYQYCVSHYGGRHPLFLLRALVGRQLQRNNFLVRPGFRTSRVFSKWNRLAQPCSSVPALLPWNRSFTMAHNPSPPANTSITTNGKIEQNIADEGVASPKMESLEVVKQAVPLHGSGGGRIRIAALLSNDYASKYIGQLVTICGWSRSIRKQGGGNLCFLVLSDGSGPNSFQVVVESSIGENFAQLLKCGAGCSFRVTGEVVKSPAKGQAVELSVRDPQKGHSLEILGMADASKYPLAKKEHTREYLREIAHLRPRSHLIGAVTRVRSHLAMATHRFFQERGFLYIHTPIITASDCEGAGEMFQVTTILPPAAPAAGSEKREEGSATGEAAAEAAGATTTTTIAKLPPTTRNGDVDYSRDFFGRRAYLTVSGQLAVEPYCCALGDVYTFGPTFRAENSHTSRHLAEFWMVEPELAFATLEDNMRIAEEYVKYCVTWVLGNCRSDIEWFAKNQEEGLVGRLENILAKPFKRVSYTEAIELLKAASPKANFKESVSWGMDLGSEHERYLTEKIYEQPCIVHDYPKDIKAFYMKSNKDGKTVRAMDLLVPKIGELVGGSQREDNLELLDKMIVSKKLDPKDYWWYRELRSYGTVPHAGFGLGFERLVMLVTGIENIRDTIPYPRYPGHAEY